MNDQDELGKALHEVRVALAEQNAWPRERWEWAGPVFMLVIGTVVGVTGGLDLLTPAYAALLAAMAVTLRWVLIVWARQGVR